MKFLVLIISASLIGLGAWAQEVVEETTCASAADFAGRAAVGLEGYDHYDVSLHAHPWLDSSEYRTLYDQGCEAAIFKATVCSITGHWPDGDECSVAYDGCKNEHWVSALDHDAIITMVDQMKADYAANGTCGPYGEYAIVATPVAPAPAVIVPPAQEVIPQEPKAQPIPQEPKVQPKQQLQQQQIPQQQVPQQQPKQLPDQG